MRKPEIIVLYTTPELSRPSAIVELHALPGGRVRLLSRWSNSETVGESRSAAIAGVYAAWFKAAGFGTGLAA